jgi:hypothetical protein
VAYLVPLSTYLYPGKVAIGNMGEVEVSNEDLCGFVSTCAGVVEEQKKKVIALPLRTLEVGSREESIDFNLFQISGECLRAFLERYEADFLTPCDVLGAVQGHEAGQRAKGCQALVPCRNGAAPTLLQMKKEHPNQVGGYVDHLHCIDAPTDLPGDERNQ